MRRTGRFDWRATGQSKKEMKRMKSIVISTTAVSLGWCQVLGMFK